GADGRARGRPLRLSRQRHAGDRAALGGALRLRAPLRLDAPRGHLARDRTLWPRLHRDLEIALRPLRPRLRLLARPRPARRALGTLPLLQRRLVLRPLSPGLRPAVPRLCAVDPRRPARGTRLPVARSLARPGGAAPRHPRPRWRPAGARTCRARRRRDLPLPDLSASLRARERCRG